MSNSMIAKRLKIIEELTDELNVLKEMYESALENDPAFQEVQEIEEKAKTEIKQKKSLVTSNTEYIRLAEQVKEKRTEIAEAKDALAQELADFYREQGTLEIEDHNGNIKKIKFSAKLTN
jgi:DNA repair ATPase RecN